MAECALGGVSIGDIVLKAVAARVAQGCRRVLRKAAAGACSVRL